MSKDPSVVRKALFSENNISNDDSKFFNSQTSSKNNHNAPKIGTLLIVLVAIAVFFKYAHLLSKYTPTLMCIVSHSNFFYNCNCEAKSI